jgi:hypothetical protein
MTQKPPEMQANAHRMQIETQTYIVAGSQQNMETDWAGGVLPLT